MNPSKPRRGRGEGTIQQRKNGTWYAQVSDNGKRITVSGKTKAEVQKKLRDTQNAIETQSLNATDRVTCEAFFHQWIEAIVAPKSAEATVSQYRRNIRLWLNPLLGSIPVSEVTQEQIDAVLQNVTDNNRGASQRNSIRNLLCAAWRYARKRKLSTLDPREESAFATEHREPFTVLTVEQSRTFLEFCKPERLACLWQTAIQTGMRIGELLALKRANVDLVKRLIHVQETQSLVCDVGQRKTILKPPKTKKGRRFIAIGNLLASQLAVHFRRMESEGNGNSEFVFCDRAGAMLSRYASPRSSLLRILKRSGLPSIRVHDLRHTHATILLAEGTHVKVVSERLGHASIQQTLSVYAHVLPGMQSIAADKVDSLFS